MCLNRIYVGVLVLVASAQAQQMCLYVLERAQALQSSVVARLLLLASVLTLLKGHCSLQGWSSVLTLSSFSSWHLLPGEPVVTVRYLSNDFLWSCAACLRLFCVTCRSSKGSSWRVHQARRRRWVQRRIRIWASSLVRTLCLLRGNSLSPWKLLLVSLEDPPCPAPAADWTKFLWEQEGRGG